MLKKTTFPCALLLLLAAPLPWLAAAPAPAVKDEWSQFRGPQRNGVATDTGLLTAWPKSGPKLVWEAKGAGRGYSSLAIAGGRVYTMGDGPTINNDKDEYVVCFEEATGKPVWKTRRGPPWTSGSESRQSSRSTPTVAGDLLFALTPQGNLVRLETSNGKERWRKQMKDLGGRKADNWGYSESVLSMATTSCALPAATRPPWWP